MTTGDGFTTSAVELREATLQGIRWIGAARLCAEVLAFASSVVLARLVSPAEFGRAVVALFVVAIASVPPQGIASPVVQRERVSAREIRTAAFLAISTGLVLAAMVFFLTPLTLTPVFGPRVVYLIQLASPAFVLAGVTAIPQALLSRRLDFRRLGASEVAAVLAGTVTALVLAAAGLNAEAVVLGAVAATASLAVLFLIQTPLVIPLWNGTKARELARFSVPAALGEIVYTAYRSIDYAILAARLRPAQVGFYWRGYQTAVEYQTKVSSIMLRVAFPVYSRADSLDRMRRLRARIVRAHTVLLFPFLTTLVAVAPQLVALLYGPRWHAAVEPMRILAIAGMAAVVASGAGPLVLAAGLPGRLLVFNTAMLIGYALTVAAFAAHGIVVVSIAVATYQVLFLLIQLVVLERAVGIPLAEIAGALLPAFASSALSLGVAWPLATALARVHAADGVLVLSVSGAAAASYLLCLRIAFADAWRDVMLIASSVSRRTASAPAG